MEHKDNPNYGKNSIKLNDKFGEWTVIGEVGKDCKVLCRCSCGEERRVNVYTLLKGKSISCGKGHDRNQDRVIDLSGRQFGDLTVLRRDSGGYWICQCSCGNIVTKHRNHLIDGRAHSCGHGTNKVPEDLTNQRFGKLVAKKYLGNKHWLCQCDCGNMKSIASANLKNGSTVSCGCLYYHTTKEDIIAKCLDYNIRFGRMPSIQDLAQIENVSYSVMSYNIDKLGLKGSEYLDATYASQGERDLYKYILSLTDKKVLHNVNDVIQPHELDIYIPEEKLAIEYNGTYWHSTFNKKEDYHQSKTIKCAQLGIQLIHIFEYEWLNPEKRRKIENILKLRLNNTEDEGKSGVYYGRQLEVCDIHVEEADKFCEENHIQGKASAPINIGLKIQNSTGNSELLAVMTFGTPRFNSEYEYELIRLAYKLDVKIVGGAEKMFKYFLNKYNPSSIITYCNASKFRGLVYVNLGFKYDDISKPNYVWVSEDNMNVLSRYQTMKKDLVAKNLGTEDETEFGIMTRLGYYKVCDCGNTRFTWNKTK